jgi:hypothetical protein
VIRLDDFGLNGDKNIFKLGMYSDQNLFATFSQTKIFILGFNLGGFLNIWSP